MKCKLCKELIIGVHKNGLCVKCYKKLHYANLIKNNKA